MRLFSFTPLASGGLEIRTWDHATLSRRKSSAVTCPPVASFSLAAKSQDGCVRPRLSRLMVVRSALAETANCSSVTPDRSIQSPNFMAQIGALDARACQAPKAWDAVDRRSMRAHDAHMPAVAKPRPEAPNFFVAWREHRGISQEAAADAIDYDRTSLGRLENGIIAYEAWHLEALAKLYKCSRGDLLDRDPNSLPPLDISGLSEQQQRLITEMAEAFRLSEAS